MEAIHMKGVPYNMYIMCGDIRTVEFNSEFEYEILNEKLAPLYILNRGNIRRWIEERAADGARANTRAVKGYQRISKTAGDYQTAMKVNAAVITDNFWVSDCDSLAYEDVVFRKNEYWRLALMRDISDLPEIPSRTPELSNIGSEEQGWKPAADGWWLYKNQKPNENLSEYITSRIGMALGFDMAEYYLEAGGSLIKTRDFTAGRYNLQHIDCIMTDHYENGVEIPDDDYLYNYRKLTELSEDIAADYINICICDALCENFDRHTKNYGLLTDRRTGEIISLAPNYDNNNSLLANRGLDINRNSGVMRYFTEFAAKNNIPLTVPDIEAKALEDIIAEAGRGSEYEFDREFLKEFILNGIERLRQI